MTASTITDLKDRVNGRVVTANDPGYDEARIVYNAMIDRHPRAVVRCADVNDVIAAVAFAGGNDLPVAIRGGGHSVPGFGTADDGVVIDLAELRTVTVDGPARTAHAQGGATWTDFNDATHTEGLATTGGVVSTTGIGGLTLGGGIGYLARSLGLSCDNLIGADVVTADGRLVRASREENPDLFWALRGGGGNFGIVTAFDYQLSPISTVYGGPVFFDLDAAGDLLRFYRDFIADAPEQFGGFPAFQIAPPLPFIPPDRHGDTLIAFVSCWTGSQRDGERLIDRVRDVAPVVAEQVGTLPYPALNRAFDPLVPAGLQHYWKANFATELTDDAIAAHMEHGARVPVVNSTVHIYPINGACHRVAPDESAFAFRDANFATVIAGMWPDPSDNEANVAWVKDYYAAIAPHSDEGGYVNFMAGDDQGRVQANYGGNYARLVEVKREYDPGNMFRYNQNISP